MDLYAGLLQTVEVCLPKDGAVSLSVPTDLFIYLTCLSANKSALT